MARSELRSRRALKRRGRHRGRFVARSARHPVGDHPRSVNAAASVRAAATSVHTATALLEEACRIIHGTDQYEYAFIVLMDPHKHTAHTVAWTGAGADRGRNARFQVATMESADTRPWSLPSSPW